MKISTSILSVNKEEAVQTFYNIEVAQTDYFHIDVMDGKFVNNNTTEFMRESASTLKQITNVPLDVHLMVEDVDKFLEEYLPIKPDIITIHVESFEDKDRLQKAINKIKQEGVKAGISIKPATEVSKIKDFLPYVSIVQVMTVEPGAGRTKINSGNSK